MPVPVPGKQVRVLTEAFGEVLLAEPLEYRGIGRVGLPDELRGRVVVSLLAPVDRDLRLGDLYFLCFSHRTAFLGRSPRKAGNASTLAPMKEVSADSEFIQISRDR